MVNPKLLNPPPPPLSSLNSFANLGRPLRKILCLCKDNRQMMNIPTKKGKNLVYMDPRKMRMTSGFHKVDFSFAAKWFLIFLLQNHKAREAIKTHACFRTTLFNIDQCLTCFKWNVTKCRRVGIPRAEIQSSDKLQSPLITKGCFSPYGIDSKKFSFSSSVNYT